MKVEIADIEFRGQESSTTSGRSKARQSRALDLRGFTFLYRHVPTGIDVSVEIPKGHYSKKEAQRLREASKPQAVVLVEAELQKRRRESR